MSEVRQFETVASLSDFSVINSDFTRARCRVMYAGRNRNYTDITEEALNKLISRKGYANVPVVAHLYKGDDGKWRVGGHDSKFVVDAEGNWEIIDETIPFGVIPESCNPSFEDITEKSGAVKRYFCVDIILWTHRYNIMDAAKSDELWFNQSMEITINHCDYDRDDYCVIDDFGLSALCLLNHDPYNKENEVEPCFPSAAVTKFELDKLKREFDILYEKLRRFDFQKGVNKMDFAQIKAKLDGKYFALSVSPDAVIAMTKENFEVFEIPYKVNTDNSDVSFSYDRAVKKYLAVSDKDAGVSSEAIKEYVSEFGVALAVKAEESFAVKIESEKTAATKNFMDKYTELSAQYDALKEKNDKDTAALERYAEAERQAAENKHREEINGIINKYNGQLYKNSEYLMYTSAVDYSKTVEQVEQDMLVILGRQASKSAVSGGEAKFSAASWGARVETPMTGKTANGRYGDLFANYED